MSHTHTPGWGLFHVWPTNRGISSRLVRWLVRLPVKCTRRTLPPEVLHCTQVYQPELRVASVGIWTFRIMQKKREWKEELQRHGCTPNAMRLFVSFVSQYIGFAKSRLSEWKFGFHGRVGFLWKGESVEVCVSVCICHSNNASTVPAWPTRTRWVAIILFHF